MTAPLSLSLCSTSTAEEFRYEHIRSTSPQVRRRQHLKPVRVSATTSAVLQGPWPAVSSNSPLVTPAPYEDCDTDEHVRTYVSRLWGEDWDSPEDSLYDDL